MYLSSTGDALFCCLHLLGEHRWKIFPEKPLSSLTRTASFTQDSLAGQGQGLPLRAHPAPYPLCATSPPKPIRENVFIRSDFYFTPNKQVGSIVVCTRTRTTLLTFSSTTVRLMPITKSTHSIYLPNLQTKSINQSIPLHKANEIIDWNEIELCASQRHQARPSEKHSGTSKRPTPPGPETIRAVSNLLFPTHDN